MAEEHSPIRSLGIVLMQTFLVILLGASVVRLGMLKPEDGRVIGFITGRVALPLLIFRAVATAEVLAVDFRVVGGLVAVKLLVQVLTMVGAALLAPSTSGPGQRLLNAGIYGLYATSSADFPIGFPVVLALFHRTSSTMDDFCAYLTMLAVAQDLSGNILALVSLEAGRAQQMAAATAESNAARSLDIGRGREWGGFREPEVLKNIAGNHLLWMVLGGVLFKAAFGWTLVRTAGQLQLPTGLREAIEVLTSPFKFLVLFQVGLSVGSLTSKVLFQEPFKYLAMVLLNLIKLVLLPLLMVAMLLLTWSGSLERRNKFLTFTLIYGALPSPAAIVAFARLYGLKADVVSLAVPMGLALSGPILWGVATLGHLYMHSTDHIWQGDPVMERYLQHPGLVSGVALLLLFLCGGKQWRCFPVVIFGHFAALLVAWHSIKLLLLRLDCRAPWLLHYFFHLLNYQVRLFGVSALWLVWGGLRGISVVRLKRFYGTLVFAMPALLAIPALLGPEMYDKPFWIMNCLYVGALVQRTVDFYACAVAWVMLLLGCILFALAGGFHAQAQDVGRPQQRPPEWEGEDPDPAEGFAGAGRTSQMRHVPTQRTSPKARTHLGSLTDIEPEEEPQGVCVWDGQEQEISGLQEVRPGAQGPTKEGFPELRPSSGAPPQAGPWGKALHYRMFVLPALAMGLYAGLQLPLDAALALLRYEMSSAWRAAISTGAAVVHCTQSAALLLLFLWSGPAFELYRAALAIFLACCERLHSACETNPQSESEESSEDVEGDLSVTEGSTSNGPAD